MIRSLLRSQRGGQLVEASLIIMPFLALIFLVVDLGWGVFVKATLQHAVRAGARYAVTGMVSGGSGQISSIKTIVQQQAMGFLDGSQSSRIFVRFYTPDTLTLTTDNRAGNLVIVSVENFQFVPLAPLLHSGASVSLTVRSGDRIEPSPGGVAPQL